jgi:hypothetical protein
MNDCLSKEDLELLSNQESPSMGLFKALEHLEKCEKCRSQVRLPSKEEILKRLELTEDEKEALSSASTVPSHLQKN